MFMEMHGPGVKFSRTLRSGNALLVIAKREKHGDNGGVCVCVGGGC